MTNLKMTTDELQQEIEQEYQRYIKQLEEMNLKLLTELKILTETLTIAQARGTTLHNENILLKARLARFGQ